MYSAADYRWFWRCDAFGLNGDSARKDWKDILDDLKAADLERLRSLVAKDAHPYGNHYQSLIPYQSLMLAFNATRDASKLLYFQKIRVSRQMYSSCFGLR